MTINRQQVCDLAAYIPVTLIRQILAEGVPPPGQTRTFAAATLFSDISGFTTMAEELGSDGPRGAEELNRVLLLTFTGMIDVIHEMGGAVSHFHGDAMSVYFPDDDGRAAERALACAQTMQQLMLTSFSRVVTNRPAGKPPIFDLTMKIGLGYGRCHETIVGDPAGNMEFVLAGAAVDEAAAAEKVARAGEIVASRAVLTQAGRPAPAAFNPISSALTRPAPHLLFDWDTCDTADLQKMATAVTPFIPPVIYERTVAGLSEMAEHRPVTSLFVQFDFEPSAGDVGGLLQIYYRWADGVVARFGGDNARLNRVLTGDKGNQLHVIFGAPVAPDAPDQAIRCALALQRERPGFVAQQRIGLAAGKVFACPVGAARRHEYTVVGDVVNLSARLTQICQDGQVLTDKTTADRVQEFITFDELPAAYLKGKQAAVRLFQPQSEQGGQAQLQVFINRWKRPLIGREQEKDLLLGGMDAALRGIGSLAAIYGSTGVGKTSLLAVGLKHWLDSGGAAYAGEGQQHINDIPFGPWLSIWRDFLGLTPGMSVDEQATAVTHRITSLVPDSRDDVGLWWEFLGLSIPQPEHLEKLSAEVKQARFFRMVRLAFQAAAAQQPILIILEGLHWADQSTLALIDEMCLHLEDHPLFIGLSFRPISQLALEALNQPTCVPIVLSDLPAKYGRRLLQQLIGATELPPAVEQHLGLRSREGLESPVNPLFLEEAVNVMVGLGVLRVNGRVQVNESLLSHMHIPDTIHGLLLARIDRLPLASRDLLQVASVIGRQFNLDPLVSISPDTPRDVATALLEELSTEEITQLMTADPEWSYLFQHAMTHEVAYESLPFARRQALHAAVANWLVGRYQDNLKPLYAVLAYHYSRANDHENGLRYALAAANNARDLFANQEAVELYTLAESHLQVLDVAEYWETAVALFLSRSDALRLLGDFSRAIKDVEQAITLAQNHNDQRKIAQAYNLLAQLKYYQSHYNKVLELTGKVITKTIDEITPTEMAKAHMWSGMAAASLSDYPAALVQLQQAKEICESIKENRVLADVLSAIAFVYYSQKKLELALETMQQAVDLSRNYSTPVKIGFILNNIALIQLNLGRPEEALKTLNETAVLAEETSQNLLAYAIVNRAEVHAYLGQFTPAQKDLDKAINLFTAMDDEFGLVEAYLLLGYEYHSAIGAFDEAEKALLQAQRLIAANPESYTEQQVRIFIGLAKANLNNGNYSQSQLLLQDAEKIIADENLSWWIPAAAYLQGKTCLAVQDTQAARIHFQRGIDSIEMEGRPDYLPMLLLELGCLQSEEKKKLEMLEQCLYAAENRARHVDRVTCYKKAGNILIRYPDYQETGQKYLSLLETDDVTV